ncbi:threonine-phosphate decarboxylase CobD [Alkalihalophilus pseudofirmus]|uniref:threonine-phosphate decarboxylase CobD n=1 Tax=Alkalihalophilus pseudofirmus TaxID=79885 RepID=UPI00259B975E|nr:threonine-phosphate decarboxylase CobD [Alkalihalophilus pseudofirmus]WEG18285.1 threonine-phosphate decarboxylase CobD [Alkalihalophilus pseudofirmus]
MSLPDHGANPKIFTKALGVAYEEGSIDFSVNTNPLGISNYANLTQSDLKDAISAYPEPHAEQLTETLAKHLKVDKSRLLAGNGAAELIFHLAHLYQGKKVLLIEPAFSEYRDACEANGCEMESIVLEDPWKIDLRQLEGRLNEVDLMFLCAPNNPTGTTYEIEEIRAILNLAAQHNTMVVIDEAFYDFQESKQTIIKEIEQCNHLIILRSMTKMYGIAGVRLGYMAASPSIIQQIRNIQPPWSVNGLAQRIGLNLLQDSLFVNETAAYIKKERLQMMTELRRMDFCVSDSVVNFYLLSEKDKRDLRPLMIFLIEHKIIPRHTYSFNGLNGRYLRLAVKTREENAALLSVLKKWRDQSC